jgi:hypothetical protein
LPAATTRSYKEILKTRLDDANFDAAASASRLSAMM